jgi:phosphoribosylformylglycinamidine synthase
LLTGRDEGEVPILDFEREKNLHAFLVEAAKDRLLASAHDCSDGGLAVALAECAITNSDATRFPFRENLNGNFNGSLKKNLGVTLDWTGNASPAAELFGESQSRVVISVSPGKWETTEALLKKHKLPHTLLGKTGGDVFSLRYNGTLLVDCPLADLERPWNDSIPEVMR